MTPILGSRSVSLLDEDEHLRVRKLPMPAFNGSALRGYAEMMEEIARAQSSRWPVGRPFAVLRRIARCRGTIRTLPRYPAVPATWSTTSNRPRPRPFRRR